MAQIKRKFIEDSIIDNTKVSSAMITGFSNETSADNADSILIYDNSAASLKKMTRANLLQGLSQGSTGDIAETSFSIANNQAALASITGFAFASGSVRSFDAVVSIEIDATADLFEQVTIKGIQTGSDWEISISSRGDDSLIRFDITSAGQVQYTSSTYAGFSSGTIKFRAITTSV